MNPAPPDITVSIVSFNTCGLLRDCLQSLQARQEEGEAALEIIVADNGSTDGSLEMVRSEFPDARLIETGGNVGYGRANNRALQEAQGRYALILNSDTIVELGALAAMRDFLDDHSDIGAVGPRLLLPDGSTQPSAFEMPSLRAVLWEQIYLTKLLPRTRLFGGFPITYWDYSSPRAVSALSGACLMVRQSLFAQIGGFDPHYFMYFEDIDLCLRLGATGAKIWFLPQARVQHRLGASSGDWRSRARMVAAYNQSRFFFFSRHGGRLRGSLLKAITLLGAGLRLGAWSLIALARPSARDQARLFREVWRETWRMQEPRHDL